MFVRVYCVMDLERDKRRGRISIIYLKIWKERDNATVVSHPEIISFIRWHQITPFS